MVWGQKIFGFRHEFMVRCHEFMCFVHICGLGHKWFGANNLWCGVMHKWLGCGQCRVLDALSITPAAIGPSSSVRSGEQRPSAFCWPPPLLPGHCKPKRQSSTPTAPSSRCSPVAPTRTHRGVHPSAPALQRRSPRAGRRKKSCTLQGAGEPTLAHLPMQQQAAHVDLTLMLLWHHAGEARSQAS